MLAKAAHELVLKPAMQLARQADRDLGHMVKTCIANVKEDRERMAATSSFVASAARGRLDYEVQVILDNLRKERENVESIRERSEREHPPVQTSQGDRGSAEPTKVDPHHEHPEIPQPTSEPVERAGHPGHPGRRLSGGDAVTGFDKELRTEAVAALKALLEKYPQLGGLSITFGWAYGLDADNLEHGVVVFPDGDVHMYQAHGMLEALQRTQLSFTKALLESKAV
jgi:hypothetical protein